MRFIFYYEAKYFSNYELNFKYGTNLMAFHTFDTAYFKLKAFYCLKQNPI